MPNIYNIYCDESCHLEHDNQKVMVLGATWCPFDKTREIAQRLRELKAKHGLASGFELKWNKVSAAKLSYYEAVLDYFLDDDDLYFRALVIPDKGVLRHDGYNQDHNTWYYKMLFRLVEPILEPSERYCIYLDIKDTCSAEKVRKLEEVIRNDLHDFSRKIVKHVQTVHSHEVEQLQLADFLIGIISYVNRGLSGSDAKLALVKRMQQRRNYALIRTTLLREQKTNIFIWKAREGP